MLEVARANKFRFDTVQMPLNVMDAHFRSFEHQVLPVLVKEGIGVLGMKSMGSGVILQSKTAQPIECLHYAMNLPTSTVITGIDRTEILDQALEAARTFKHLSRQDVAALLARTAVAAAAGQYELFKTTANYDGTAHHPQWLG
jgi:aryl-alcohol dehydrogenase-like predicted oxidoreductase